MTVNGINGIGAQPAMGGAGAAEQTDPTCKNLQQQIDRLQQELKEVSANQEMPAEAKMKKRQELQKQISELQIQLRQRQIEVKKEEREKKKEESSFDDLIGAKGQNGQNAAQSVGLSADSMTAMISADQSVKQANVQGNTVTKMEGKANVLETEIALDSARNGDTSRKQAELSDVKAAAQKAEASQLSTLAEAGEALQDAAKSEKSDKQADDEDKKGSREKGSEEEENTSSVSTDEETLEAMEAGFRYHPVDVRL